ncbi:MAG: signal peptidase I [Candidatus Limnocylindria bacterium]
MSINGTYEAPAEEQVEPPFSWRAVLEIVQALALAVIISVVLNLFVVQVTEVRQRSMEPTLLQNDRVLVSKVDYRIGQPQACDIIVFNPPIDSAIPYVKRVLAVAGETLELRDGEVFVNGSQRTCPGAHGLTQSQAPRIVYPYTVQPGEIFTIGDNRQASSDSRSFGPVPNENIIGKVIIRFWPLDRLRFFQW